MIKNLQTSSKTTSEFIKRDVSHLMLSLDSPAQRFIDECVIPVMTLASLIPGPQQVVTVPATALACAVRAVFPVLERGTWQLKICDLPKSAAEGRQRASTFPLTCCSAWFSDAILSNNT